MSAHDLIDESQAPGGMELDPVLNFCRVKLHNSVVWTLFNKVIKHGISPYDVTSWEVGLRNVGNGFNFSICSTGTTSLGPDDFLVQYILLKLSDGSNVVWCMGREEITDLLDYKNAPSKTLTPLPEFLADHEWESPEVDDSDDLKPVLEAAVSNLLLKNFQESTSKAEEISRDFVEKMSNDEDVEFTEGLKRDAGFYARAIQYYRNEVIHN